MNRWTVGQTIAAGMAAVTTVTLVVSALAIFALQSALAAKDQVIDVNARNLVYTQTLATHFEHEVAASRALLLTGADRYQTEIDRQRREQREVLAQLGATIATDQGRRFMAEFPRQEAEHQRKLDEVIVLRRSQGALTDAVIERFEDEVKPLRDQIGAALADMTSFQETQLTAAKTAASAAADTAIALLAAMAAIGVAAAVAIAVWLTRSMSGQIGTAVHHIQTSSTQLQSATTEQAAGTKEQTSAVAEVSATLRELASTARQMMESAQRVTRVAEEAAGAARNGGVTVARAQEAITGIRRQVDLIVGHMLDLGRKTQQVGAILEIINELAEQTNILAINASIESAGAGEAGRRFGVVAEEVRKLADRVGTSAKDIRALIDDIRAAANTTVMATEDGAKASDAGARQFDEVSRLFDEILATVETTTDATREIELGTKQQVTAVEQVNAALAGVAQAAKDSETTTRQTAETAAQLAQLSQQLSALVRADAAGRDPGARVAG